MLNAKASAESAALVFASDRYQSWKKRVLENGCKLYNESVCYVVQRSPNSFYMALIDCEMETPEGDMLSRCIVLRGAAVAIIPLLYCQFEWKTVLVKQRRVVDGDFSYEFPSGGIELDSDPVVAAVQEVSEELAIDLSLDDLISLTPLPLKVCESLTDELVYWFAFKMEVDESIIHGLNNKSTGVHQEQEHIILTVKKISELYTARNFQVLTGLQVLHKQFPEIY